MDITDPEAPLVVSRYATGDMCFDLQVSGSYAYVVGFVGMIVFDISDPTFPIQIGSWRTTESYITSICLDGNYAYLSEMGYGLRIIDISNPTNPTLISSLATPGVANGIFLNGRYVFIADRSDVQIADISDPFNPVLVGSHDTPAITTSIAVLGDIVLASNTYSLELLRTSLTNTYEESQFLDSRICLGNYPNPFNA